MIDRNHKYASGEGASAIDPVERRQEHFAVVSGPRERTRIGELLRHVADKLCR